MMKNIVIIRLGRLGDVALTAPTIKNLRFLYPDSKILFVTRQQYQPLVDILPGVDDTLIFPDEGSYFDLVNLSAQIDENQPDLIVDLHKNFRSFHLANLTKAPYKVVYKKRRKQRRLAVSDKKFVNPVPQTTDQYNLIIEQLKGEIICRRPDIYLSAHYLFDVKPEREGVALVPGASSPVKMWPTDNFAELAERLISDYHIPISLLLGPGEDGLAEYFNEFSNDEVAIYKNLSIPEIAKHLGGVRLTVTNDSGLMHISSGVGTPTAALFGPTHEQLGFFPLGVHDFVLEVDEPCRPCSLHGSEPCYREEQYCFTRLTVDSVYGRICECLDNIKFDRAVFIDRDGTLIVDHNYLADPEKIEFIPGSLDAVKKLKEAGYRIIVVSNQSGVARGFFPIETVEKVHDRLRHLMSEAGAEPDEIRYCPYHIDGDIEKYTIDHPCRKPRPGMLNDAAKSLGLDLKRSFMVGDKLSDFKAGRAAGTQSLLVRTGKGPQAVTELPHHGYMQPDFIGEDLEAAADFILSRSCLKKPNTIAG